VYLVASRDDVVGLLAALPGRPVQVLSPGPPASAEDIADELEPLFAATVGSLTRQQPPVWTLFSAQASLAVLGATTEARYASRAQLRDNPEVATQFVLPADVRRTGQGESSRAGEFAVGRQKLSAADGREWSMSFSAAQDGATGGWRYLTLAVLPTDQEPDSEVAAQVAEPLRAWETAMSEGSVDALWGLVSAEPGCFAASTPNGEDFLLQRGDYLITMLKTALLWGPASKSEISIDRLTVAGDVAAVSGTWKLVSFAFGMGKPYAFHTVLRRTDEGWKLASLCAGPG
jgi:hypothetical protein